MLDRMVSEESLSIHKKATYATPLSAKGPRQSLITHGDVNSGPPDQTPGDRWKRHRRLRENCCAEHPDSQHWPPEVLELLAAGYQEGGKAKHAAIAAVRGQYPGLPGRVISRLAKSHGWLQKQESIHRRWNTEELQTLWRHAGIQSVRAIAERLGRSERAVRWRLSALGLSAKVMDSWSQRMLRQMLHVGANRLHRWIRSGALKLVERRVRNRALRVFVDRHRHELNWLLFPMETRRWLEEDHPLQPVETSPIRAAQKHVLVVRRCPGCGRRTRGNAYFNHRKYCQQDR